MKFKSFICAVAVFSLTLCAETITLPAPQKNSGMDLMQALNERCTIRSYKTTDLDHQQISNLLWCANGINRKNGKRTAPSAINRQEISLYLLTSQAVYKYIPDTNALEKVKDGDFRKWAGKFTAPVYVALVADLKKAASPHYAKIDTGYVSQNIYLYCASSGLGTCAIGSFDRIAGSEKGAKLHEALNLNKDQIVMLTHSVGIRKDVSIN